MSTPLKILVSLATLLPLLAFGMVSVLGSDSRLPEAPEPVVVESPSTTEDAEELASRERRAREAREALAARKARKAARERREQQAQRRQEDNRAGAHDDDGQVRVIPRQPRPVGDDDGDRDDADDGDDDDAGGDD